MPFQHLKVQYALCAVVQCLGVFYQNGWFARYWWTSGVCCSAEQATGIGVAPLRRGSGDAASAVHVGWPLVVC